MEKHINKIILVLVIVLIGGVFFVKQEQPLGSFFSIQPDQKTAFNELSVAEPTPVVQVQFPYNINTDIWEIRDNGGSSVVADNKAKISTGSGANQSSTILTRETVKYNPGQGALTRFTAIFTTGIADSTQWVGIGNTTDGYFFGYDETTFGVMRRQGGVPETRRLTIGTKSSDADSITITLNNETKAVTVTDGADATVTANEIAAVDFSNVGEGWEVHSMGDKVFFTSFRANSKPGTYSLTDATSAIGTFAQSLVGATSTDTVVAQTAWNKDKCDGTGISGMTCDFTLGNVFQIQYQWLGFGNINYFLEDPKTGKYILVHQIEYSNSTTTPSVDNPTLPLSISATNEANTSDVVIEVGSMAGFVEGRNILPGLPHSFSTTTLSVGTTETPTLTIHAHDIYQGVVNRVKIRLTTASVAIDGTKPAIIRIRKNATLVGASFSPLDSDVSTIHVDRAAVSVSGGEVVFTASVAKTDTITIDLEKLGLTLFQPDFLTISVEATAGTLVAVSTINWQERF